MRPDGLRQYWQRRKRNARRLRANGKVAARRSQLQIAEMKANFLLLYAQTGLFNKTAAMLHWPDGTNISAKRIVDYMEHDALFAQRVTDARVAFGESLEEEAHRRAVIGYDKPVFWNGEKVGAITQFSDALLIALLKANIPEKYRDRVDISIDVKAEIKRIAEELGVDLEIAEAEWQQLEPRLLGKG